MDTLRTIASDLRRILKQNNAELELPDAQLHHWTLYHADRLRMQHIVKRRSGAFLTTFVLPVLSDPLFADRRYVELPHSIYDLDLDAGVQSLSFYEQSGSRPEFTRVELFRTDPSRFHSRWMSEYERPPRQRYFWREGKRLWFDGLSVGANIPNIEAKLYTTLPTVQELDAQSLLDVPLEFPRELMAPLMQAVISMGRFALALPGQHLTNDGTNRPAAMTLGKPEKTMSVNNPIVNTGSDADA